MTKKIVLSDEARRARKREREIGSLRARLQSSRNQIILLQGALADADARRLELSEPIPLILSCPGCGVRHVDTGDFAAAKPHHTHACQHCGVVWRPAVRCTVGVRFLPGFKSA